MPQYSVCVVCPTLGACCETFIQDQIDHLPFAISVLHGPGYGITDNGRNLFNASFPARLAWRAVGKRANAACESFRFRRIERFLKHRKVAVVLAQYGMAGARIAALCERLNVPLVVHFHGYDAWRHDVLEKFRDSYRRMFRIGSRFIAVSQDMRRQLVDLSAPEDRVVLNPYSVDTDAFHGADPVSAAQTFLAVGRFVEKKAPHLTILAFRDVHRSFPESRLVMAGDGPLLGPCQDLVSALGIKDRVEFTGPLTREQVIQRMRAARCFLQHSVVASNGDAEGTPVAILESQACGLPVVATRHMGIKEAVIDGTTGFLCNERNPESMAEHMKQLAAEPGLARQMGVDARAHILQNYSRQQRLGALADTLHSVRNR